MSRPSARLLSFRSVLGLLILLAPGPALAQVVIALEGEVAPGTGGGTFDIFSPRPVINDLGHVAFGAFLSGGTASRGVFLDAGNGLVAVALIGDVAPGTGGGTFTSVGDPALNAEGDLAFSAGVLGGTGGGGGALFFHSGGLLSVIATTQQMAPGTSGFYAAFGPNVSMNDSGEVAFHGNVSGAGNVSSGIFVEGGLSSRAVFLRAESTPAALPGTYSSFSDPAINDAGDVVALAAISPAVGPFTTAVVVESGGTDEIVARIGDSAPGTGAGTYSAFAFAAAPPGINASGDVFFVSDVTGGTATRGLFVDSVSTQSALVLPGQPVPSLPGLTYFSFALSRLTANDAGAVGWSSILGPSGVQALSVGASGDSAQLIAKLGDPVPDTGGATYQLLVDNPSINSDGAAAFRALLTGGTATSAIIAAPEPAAADSALVAVAMLAYGAMRSRRRPTSRP
jgi:hypothetical protein